MRRLILASILASPARAARSRRLALHEARALASGLMPVDETVLIELNRLVATRDGRRQMRDVMARMDDYRPLVEGTLTAHGLPTELAAIPIIESGYANLPGQAAACRCAGLWQLTRATARKFGLRVDHKRDERRAELKAT